MSGQIDPKDLLAQLEEASKSIPVATTSPKKVSFVSDADPGSEEEDEVPAERVIPAISIPYSRAQPSAEPPPPIVTASAPAPQPRSETVIAPRRSLPLSKPPKEVSERQKHEFRKEAEAELSRREQETRDSSEEQRHLAMRAFQMNQLKQFFGAKLESEGKFRFARVYTPDTPNMDRDYWLVMNLLNSGSGVEELKSATVLALQAAESFVGGLNSPYFKPLVATEDRVSARMHDLIGRGGLDKEYMQLSVMYPFWGSMDPTTKIGFKILQCGYEVWRANAGLVRAGVDATLRDPKRVTVTISKAANNKL